MSSELGFIGKFSAPGTDEVGVLSLTLTHDYGTGMKRGGARLEKRPYWEGLTRFTLNMPATSEREAMHLTGLWTGCGVFDGEMCPVILEAVQAITRPAPAPALEQEIAWSELRSACHRKAWREAWGIVGVDHTGEATPGEVYIFGVARQARAVAAALAAWCYVSGDAGTILLKGASWARIKQIAGWESQAAAQHDQHVMARRAAAVMRLAMASGAHITVGGREITAYNGWAHLAIRRER